MSSHEPLSSLNTLITYVGTAWATALISTSLPALENYLCCQFEILFNTLSLTSLKKLQIIEERPKYFLYLDTTLSFNMPLIAKI